MTEPPRIEDHALIGDGRTAALVASDGSIDWLCLPRFDSPALFAAIVDAEHGGLFRVAPCARARVERAYLEETNVLRTRFFTQDGTLELTDLMPIYGTDDRMAAARPDHELVRHLRCSRGQVRVGVDFSPRPGFGEAPLRLERKHGFGLRIETRDGLVTLRSDAPIERLGPGVEHDEFLLRAGESCAFRLTFDDEAPGILPPLGPSVRETIEQTSARWRSWAKRARYEGPHRAAVVRSALVLKALTFAPSGAIVAAPTLALPERLGGTLNWDYRFCWLRDASFTVRALFGLGYEDEAEAFLGYLLHSTRLTRPELRVVYDVFGRQIPEERVLPLRGHRDSRPVRVGNAARDQFQLDVYGEVIDAVVQHLNAGGEIDRETSRMLVDFGSFVCRNWERPDEGIWEVREGRFHHTHSLALCWTALDHLIDLHARGHLRRVPLELFEKNRRMLRTRIETRCVDAATDSYVQREGSTEVDASLLVLPYYGYTRADAPRMRSTFARISRELFAGDGLLYRYRQSVTAGEGAFVICSFWAAEYLASGGGTLDEANALFTALLRHANDVGLYAEEVDGSTGRALGNFPQGFSHVGLLNAALSLERRTQGRATRAPRGDRSALRDPAKRETAR